MDAGNAGAELRRLDGDHRRHLRRNVTLKLTLAQHAGLERRAAREGRPMMSVLLEQLSAFLADLERPEARGQGPGDRGQGSAE